MARCADNHIKKLRKSAKISANMLAEQVGCDVTTIYRYEQGKLNPSPDVMYQICKALGDLSTWCTWMQEQYPGSYAMVHPSVPNLDTAGIVLSLYAGILEALNAQKDVFAELSGGKIPENDNKKRLREITKKIAQFSQALLNKLL